MHRPRRRIRQAGLVPHHARPRDSLRHRPQARQSRAAGGRLLAATATCSPSAAITSSTPRAAIWTSRSICVNNLTYAMTGGQTAPTTPGEVITATIPYGVFEPSFNLPYLAEAAGAVYVARWTTYPREAAQPLHGGDVSQERLLLHRSASRPARRSTSAATRWATASTP